MGIMIDRWDIEDKEAEAWMVKGRLQIRYVGTIHNIELPSVTPQPRKGHWEHGKELSKEYRGRILVDVTYADWHCSNCNYVIKGTVKPKWNFCPNCGSDNREIEI